MNDPMTANIKCPYFVALTKVSLSCEGIECGKIMQWFTSDEQKKKYIEKYCIHSESDCPFYKALEAKYDGSTV